MIPPLIVLAPDGMGLMVSYDSIPQETQACLGEDDPFDEGPHD